MLLLDEVNMPKFLQFMLLHLLGKVPHRLLLPHTPVRPCSENRTRAERKTSSDSCTLKKLFWCRLALRYLSMHINHGSCWEKEGFGRNLYTRLSYVPVLLLLPDLPLSESQPSYDVTSCTMQTVDHLYTYSTCNSVHGWNKCYGHVHWIGQWASSCS